MQASDNDRLGTTCRGGGLDNRLPRRGVNRRLHGEPGDVRRYLRPPPRRAVPHRSAPGCTGSHATCCETTCASSVGGWPLAPATARSQWPTQPLRPSSLRPAHVPTQRPWRPARTPLKARKPTSCRPEYAGYGEYAEPSSGVNLTVTQAPGLGRPAPGMLRRTPPLTVLALPRSSVNAAARSPPGASRKTFSRPGNAGGLCKVEHSRLKSFARQTATWQTCADKTQLSNTTHKD